ncbi:ATP synthase d subunit [Dimargaris cristalligena]|uniref:ATP synthase subunit d, mitochondrial n=1 Tax=Dimargaris cristalligena TaxID=215637 RepID=A0A4V1J4T3_9FUNG|nr:ATP synthase d subunit [Dimargaris cristalligena]RKP36659.1 ATP synthase subunit D [Dimargaris cristalligena]|eukprot:RKP36659.1 ATP synthase subunit D [Dimargaris cristalligena]
MSVARSAAAKINWSKLNSGLLLKQETTAALATFRKRFDETQRQLNQLREQKTDVDFAHYRSTLKNKAVVDRLQGALQAQKAVPYDLAGQLKVIGAFEAKAVEKAQATAGQVDANLSDLKAALQNIDTARPVEDITLDDVSKIFPEFEKEVEEAVKKGEWYTPGYDEKFGSLSLL